MSERGAVQLRAVTIARLYLPLAVIVTIAVVLRIVWLDRLPGINGDEAWQGALAQRWAAGDLTLWRTPSGNFPGPIQTALVALGQYVMPSEFVTLRIPTVISSLAAMVIAWWIGRRHFDAATGRIALMLMATLPANIAFARFGWDPSHSPLLVLGGIAVALERRLALMLSIYALALWNHPTNVFAAPLLLIAFAAAERPAANNRLFAVRISVAFTAMALATAIMMATATQAGQFVNRADVMARLVSPADWLTIVLLLGRTMAGEPWFVSLAGSSYGALLPLVDMVALSLLLGTTWFTIRTVTRDGLSLRGGLLLGWLAMVASFALIGGSAALTAPSERYAFVLVAPTAMGIAIAARSVLGRAAGTLREALATATLGALLLASTIAFYLVPLANRDATAHMAFRTGPVEPKEAAARWISAEARRAPIRLITENWWLHWPLAYRLAGQPVVVVDAEKQPLEALRETPLRTIDVVFAGGPADRRLAVDPGARLTYTAQGYDGRAVVRLWERGLRP